jgi:2-keto-4-pentenoate hydratase/2-oxohepta-3-ene-1,7-dioic acid hydratase in catechol pathway
VNIDGTKCQCRLRNFILVNKLAVGQAIEKNFEVAVKVVAGGSALDYDASFTGEIKVIDQLLSPVSQKEAGTVRCVGLNYKEHAAEMKMTLPKTPTFVY